MERLARAAAAPSSARRPSQAALGGVGRRTRETIRLVEAWGAEVVLVETVGVGQSETMVAEMTDVFVLLIAPGGGDELQGVKRGIMEMADLILVNKADGPHEPEAARTRADYAGALRLLRPRPGDPPGWPKAMCVSALTGAGLDKAWAAVEALAAAREASGAWETRRRSPGRGLVRARVRGRADPAAQRRPRGGRAAARARCRSHRGTPRPRRRRRGAARRLPAPCRAMIAPDLELPNLTGPGRMAGGEPMKTVKIELPDEEAEALARAAAAGGFASPSELARAVIEDFLTTPVEYDREALARDIAQHQAEKQRGEVGLTPEEARAWLRNASSA